MTVLWYAIGIYMIGVAVVLYSRPRTMFREDGMWKEFGLASDTDQTIFPFWMFALIWAILSYAIASLISMFFASIALKSESTSIATAANNAPNASFIQPISSHPNTNVGSVVAAPPVGTFGIPTAMQAAMPPNSMPSIPNAPARVPGYYILDPYANPAHPRYIYYGPEPPGVQS
jgi:hypothetical protein